MNHAFEARAGGLRIACVHLLAVYVCCVFRPARFAALSCRLSDDANSSAPHSSAQATCRASIALTGLASRTVIAEPMTEGVNDMISASRTSSSNRRFASLYWAGVNACSRKRRLSAETISGTQSTLSPSSEARAQMASTALLPLSSTKRFAKADESRYAFTRPLRQNCRRKARAVCRQSQA